MRSLSQPTVKVVNKELHYLDVIEIHAPDFDWDIDGSSDSHAATDQKAFVRPTTSLSTDYESRSIDSYLYSLTG